MPMRKPFEKSLKYLHDSSTGNIITFALKQIKNVFLIHHSCHPTMNRKKIDENTLNICILYNMVSTIPRVILVDAVQMKIITRWHTQFYVALHELGITISSSQTHGSECKWVLSYLSFRIYTWKFKSCLYLHLSRDRRPIELIMSQMRWCFRYFLDCPFLGGLCIKRALKQKTKGNSS